MRKTKNKPSERQSCFVPTITKAEARSEFERIAGKDSSCSSRLGAFTELMDDLTNEQSNFSWLDVLRESHGRNIEVQCLDSLFQTWVDVYANKLKKCEVIHGCYDRPVYRVI